MKVKVSSKKGSSIQKQPLCFNGRNITLFIKNVISVMPSTLFNFLVKKSHSISHFWPLTILNPVNSLGAQVCALDVWITVTSAHKLLITLQKTLLTWADPLMRQTKSVQKLIGYQIRQSFADSNATGSIYCPSKRGRPHLQRWTLFGYH